MDTTATPFTVIAVDGKSVRGSAVASGRCRHLLSAFTHTGGLVLGQLDVDVKTNEIPLLAELLDKIDLKTVEPVIHLDSYGYRPGRSALDAVAVCRRCCWQHDWVIHLDVARSSIASGGAWSS